MKDDPTNSVTLAGACIKKISFVSGSLYVTGGEPSAPNPTVINSGNSWTVFDHHVLTRGYCPD